MAVYTEVPDGELAAFVKAYDIGDVVSCKGIAEGVENSNFLMHTTQGSYILTLKGTNPPNPKAPQGEIWADTSAVQPVVSGK